MALRYVLGFLLVLGTLLSLGSRFAKAEIPTVERVDLAQYLGLWYEQLRIENSFQDNEVEGSVGVCRNTTAEYSTLDDGRIQVKNTCYRNTSPSIAIAKARVVEGSNNAKLKVNFTGIPALEWLGIGDGDYWILALGPVNSDGLYSWALVGAPGLDFGWVLSRTPNLAVEDIEAALKVAESVGYDRNLFIGFRE